MAEAFLKGTLFLLGRGGGGGDGFSGSGAGCESDGAVDVLSVTVALAMSGFCRERNVVNQSEEEDRNGGGRRKKNHHHTCTGSEGKEKLLSDDCWATGSMVT